MALIIEDGTGVAGAQSYCTAAELQTYADDRGITLTASPDVLLIKSTDYSETLSYPGSKTSDDQPLQWPRTGVRIDGYPIPSDLIPGALKQAQLVTAVAIDQGRDPLAPIEPGVKREKVDVLEVEYQDGASARALDVAVTRAWARLTSAGASGGANQIGVRRG